MAPTVTTSPSPLRSRTLLLADWKTDPQAVVAACAARIDPRHASVDLVIPASLHGIEWVGDPYANVACARRALDNITELLRGAGIEVTSATVGDHDPTAAALDATLSQPPEQILVCGLRRRISLFDLAHRVSRATRASVISLPVPAAEQRRGAWLRLWRGECEVAQRLSHISTGGVLTPLSH
jgi:hypothetical protein